MNKLKYLAVAFASAFFVGIFGMQNINADSPRYDMVDVSNHNGAMGADEFRYMRDNYGVKAVTTKISEGTTYSDWTAAGNIQAAKDAGLYINGYHYLWATDVASAIAEADYAVAVAQQAGLPVGAVLAVDVENQNQMTMGRAMQPVVQAFENEVMRAGGFRSTGYSMGSHIDVTPDGDKAWVASYPYKLSSQQNWYNTEHAWQFTSSATFASSIGVFDVSQLYDDFFTAGQDANNNVPAPSKPDTTNFNDVYVLDEWDIWQGKWYGLNYDMSIVPIDYNNLIPAGPITMTDRYGNKLADQTIHGNDGRVEFFTLNDTYNVMSRVGQYIEVNIGGEPVWLKSAYAE